MVVPSVAGSDLPVTARRTTAVHRRDPFLRRARYSAPRWSPLSGLKSLTEAPYPLEPLARTVRDIADVVPSYNLG